ncbi:outer membrane receptor protein involved in Fe transport [Pedobacter sp. AK013]|uniref:outer membrane beta-barrel protein n=1 Tax=Pedobacter sp. AK013 TaxID=2723071 RepID=UPI0016100CBC|nr:outer membrane beta-barrel protein [Pedobacter sp. AK013]MBB6238628.1 outer membrane receptor protein involved in Fe transport [Pedobacter sp. AK013]
MKHIAITFTLFVCFWLNSTAQLKERSFSGHVKEKTTNAAIPFASVTILNEAGKLLVSGIADDKGKFTLGTTQQGKLSIEFSFMAYHKVSVTIEADKNKVDLGTVLMEPDTKMLDEVSVTAEKAAVSLKLDKKVFEVGKDILSQSGSVTELLAGVPSVSVAPGGGISLRGNSSVLVLINGSRSGLTAGTALEQLPADQVERVEVIANPSAQYDASGSAGIINIVLKRNKKSGFNGQLRLVGGIPNDNRISPSLNYKSNKLNLFSTIGLRFSDYVGLYKTNQTVNQQGFNSMLNQRQDENRHDDGRLVYFGADYQPDSLNTITMAYLRNATKDHDKTTLGYNYFSSAPDSSLVRTGESWENRNYNQVEFNYTRIFKKPGKKLTVDMQYDFWNSAKNWNLATSKISPSVEQRPEIRTSNIGSSKDFAAQSDMVIPLNSKATLTYGIKAENRRVNSDFLAEGRTANGWAVIDNIDNGVGYNEFIGSAYLQFNSKISHFSYQLGLRSEYTEVRIDDRKDVYDSKKDYLKLFPTLHLGYEMSKSTSLQLSYSRRINRPALNNLYPFNEITDYNSRYVGNPGLNPSYANVLELGLLKRIGTLIINPSVYYQHNTGVMIDYNYREKGLFISMPVNIKQEERSGAELSVLYNPYKWLQMNMELNAYHFSQAGIYANQDFAFSGNTYTSRLGTQVKLPSKFSVQARYNFTGAINNAQSNMKAIHSIDMGIGQNFLKDKASLLFDVSNLFNLRKFSTTTTGQGFSITQVNSPNAARYRLTFVYRLNLSDGQGIRQAKSGNRS